MIVYTLCICLRTVPRKLCCCAIRFHCALHGFIVKKSSDPAINECCVDLLWTFSLLFTVMAVSIIYLRQRPHVALETPSDYIVTLAGTEVSALRLAMKPYQAWKIQHWSTNIMSLLKVFFEKVWALTALLKRPCKGTLATQNWNYRNIPWVHFPTLLHLFWLRNKSDNPFGHPGPTLEKAGYIQIQFVTSLMHQEG